MTGAERIEIAQLRDEMREGFKEMREGFAALASRVGSLETTRAVDEAVTDTTAKIKRRATDDSRWRAGLIVGIAGSLVLGLLNLVSTHIP